jgi:dTDP-4-dehydrorhamnose reductase
MIAPLSETVEATFERLIPSMPDTAPLPRHFRVLMTGVTSIHGWPLFQRLTMLLPQNNLIGVRPPKMRVPAGDNCFAHCVTDHVPLTRIRDEFQPTHVIHAAGICDLDVCEERPQWAEAINTGGSRVVAELFGDSAHILFVSTDLVFSGNTPPPQGYAEYHAPDPISVVGRTFLAGEQALSGCPRRCIVRLGLPIGGSVTGGKGAVDWIDSRLRNGRPVTLFHDEYRSCITCTEIANVLPLLMRTEATGLFHFGGPDAVSLHEIGRRVLAAGGYPGHLLKGISRFEEKDGPPRVGNIALNSQRLRLLMTY